MKKKSLKSLSLNKKSISNLNRFIGGKLISDPCQSDDCFSHAPNCQSRLNLCDPPETIGDPCISLADGCDCTELGLC